MSSPSPTPSPPESSLSSYPSAPSAHSSDDEIDDVEGAVGGLAIHHTDDEIEDDDDDESDVPPPPEQPHPQMVIHHDEDAEDAFPPLDSPTPAPPPPLPAIPPAAAAPPLPSFAAAPFIPARLELLLHYVSQLNSADTTALINAATALRRLLSVERNAPIQECIDSGCVPRLVELMRDSDIPQIQFECAWCLTNISSGTSAQTRAVMNAGALPVFINLLSHYSHEVAEQCAWALGNIAGDSVENRDRSLEAGALTALVEHCSAPLQRLEMLRNSAHALSNLCRGRPAPAFELIAPSVPTLVRWLDHSDTEVCSSAIWGISFISDDHTPSYSAINTLISIPTCLPRLVELLSHPLNEIVVASLRAVGNIVAGNDSHTQAVLNAGAMPKFVELLSSRKMSIRKEACWVLSNCTDYLPRMFDADVFPKIMNILQNDEFDVCKQAAWVLSNSASCSNHDQIRLLVSLGLIPTACTLLNTSRCTAEIIQLGIETLMYTLNSGSTQLAMSNDGQPINPYLNECHQYGVSQLLHSVTLSHRGRLLPVSVRHAADQLYQLHFGGIVNTTVERLSIPGSNAPSLAPGEMDGDRETEEAEEDEEEDPKEETSAEEEEDDAEQTNPTEA